MKIFLRGVVQSRLSKAISTSVENSWLILSLFQLVHMH